MNFKKTASAALRVAGPGRGALLVRGWGKVLTATWMDGECHLTALRADLSFSLQGSWHPFHPRSPSASRPLRLSSLPASHPHSACPPRPQHPVTLWTQLSPGYSLASGQLSPRPRRPLASSGFTGALSKSRLTPKPRQRPTLPLSAYCQPFMAPAQSSEHPVLTACPLGESMSTGNLGTRGICVSLSMVGPLGTLQEVGPLFPGMTAEPSVAYGVVSLEAP